jgi:hypothetical protein
MNHQDLYRVCKIILALLVINIPAFYIFWNHYEFRDEVVAVTIIMWAIPGLLLNALLALDLDKVIKANI